MGLETIAFGPFVLDRQRQALTRNGEPVPIGNRGYILLEALLDAAGEPVDKATLMERAWPGTIVEEGNLTVQIATLRRQLGSNADALLVTVPRVGYRFVAPAPASPREAGGPAVIAVLPFDNLSSDPEQLHFADGLVEDLITALSRFKSFAVVSRNSTFVYKGRAVDVRQVAKELGVRYVLEGSVRRTGTQLRVTAQLIDATTGAHLWAERFDGPFDAVFDFQDRITESVIGFIEPQVRKVEIERARRKRPENLDAYDHYLRALPLLLGVDGGRYSEAVDLFERAIELDPGFAPALAYAAWAHAKRAGHGTTPPGIDDAGACVALVERALATDSHDAVVLAIAGMLVAHGKQDREAGYLLNRRALELNPNSLVVLNLAGSAYRVRGEFDDAIGCYQRALQLCPGAPDRHWSVTGIAIVHLAAGRFEDAVVWGRRALETAKAWEWPYCILAAAYAHLGRDAEAEEAVQTAMSMRPGLTLSVLVPSYRHPATTDRFFVEGLRMAGLPEEQPAPMPA